jgi:hypothetical protein
MEVSQNDRIAQDAREYCKGVGNSFKAHVMTNAYVAGAMAERDRAKVLVDFIQEIVDFPPAQSKSAMSEWIDKYRDEARNLLGQWERKDNIKHKQQ